MSKVCAARSLIGSAFLRIFLVGTCVAFAWVFATWLIAKHYYDDHALAVIETGRADLERESSRVVAGIRRSLDLRAGVAETLANENLVLQVLATSQSGSKKSAKSKEGREPAKVLNSSLDRLNTFIAIAQKQLALDALWVGDANGYGVSCATPTSADSPIGVSYADRVYFREALAGHPGFQFAIGKTTRIGGLFFSSPVHIDGQFAGFVVAKTNIAVLDGWLEQTNALLSDGNGVVILATDKALEMSVLPGGKISSLSANERQNQYARTEFSEVRISRWSDSRFPSLIRMGGSEMPLLEQSLLLPEFGLTVTVFHPLTQLLSLAREQNLLFSFAAGIGILMIGVVGVIVAYLQYVRRSNRLLRRQKQRLDDAQQLAKLGSWEFDATNNSVIFSDETRRIFDIDPSKLWSTFENFLERVHPDDRDLVVAAYRNSITGNGSGEIVHRAVLPDNSVKYVHQRWHTFPGRSRKRKQTLGFVQDITESHDAESRLRLSARIIECIDEGICIADPDLRIVEVNPALCKLTGYRREDVVGRTPSIFKSGTHPPEFYAEMWQAILTTDQWHGELWNKRPDGTVYAVKLAISTVKDSSDKVTHFVGAMTDITPAKQYEAELENIAHFDLLTGVPNRLLLADRMRQAITYAERSGSFVAICYLDLDGFKPINDTYGHDAGDRLLIEVARRLTSVLRGSDTVARMGGDEFALVLGIDDVDDCLATVTRMINELTKPMDIARQMVIISASVGVAIYPLDGTDPDVLLRHADEAMYRAKHTGKNRIEVFSRPSPGVDVTYGGA